MCKTFTLPIGYKGQLLRRRETSQRRAVLLHRPPAQRIRVDQQHKLHRSARIRRIYAAHGRGETDGIARRISLDRYCSHTVRISDTLVE